MLDANANMNGPGVVDEIAFMEGLTGTITLSTGEMVITDDLTIAGPGSDVISISGRSMSIQVVSRIFNIDDGDNDNDIVVSIRGLMFINGFDLPPPPIIVP